MYGVLVGAAPAHSIGAVDMVVALVTEIKLAETSVKPFVCTCFGWAHQARPPSAEPDPLELRQVGSGSVRTSTR